LKSESVVRELVPTLRERGEQAVTEAWEEVVAEHGITPTAREVRKTVGSTRMTLQAQGCERLLVDQQARVGTKSARHRAAMRVRAAW
jgi:hypothetical protein